MVIKQWRLLKVRGEEQRIQYGFGYDFRESKYVIAEEGTGKVICEMDKSLTEEERELAARIIGKAPQMIQVIEEAIRRLGKATNPNAKRLFELLKNTYESLDEQDE